MFLETGPDELVRTNALNFLQADDDECSEDAAVSPRDGALTCNVGTVLGGAAA